MSESLPRPRSTITVSGPDDLVTLWGTLVGDGGFGRRSLWLTVLDDAGRPAPVVVPVDGIPCVPTPSDVDALEMLVAGILDLGTVVLLLSRPGGCEVLEDDRTWASALAPLAPCWPVHLATVDADGRCTVRSVLSP